MFNVKHANATAAGAAWISSALLAVALAGCNHSADYEKTATGVIVTPASGSAKRVRLEVVNPRIVHVTAVPGTSFDLPASLMIAPRTSSASAVFKVEVKGDSLLLSTAEVTATVDFRTGAVAFADAAGAAKLAEAPREAFAPVELDGKTWYGIHQLFNPGTDEAFYGLGQHQNAQMNYNGEDVVLSQHNMDIAIPFVVSSRNYGVLWDNNSITRFGDPKPYGLASRDLKVTGTDGKDGFTASYFIDGKLKLMRSEADINYQFIKDLMNRPAEMLGQTSSNTSGQKTDIPGETIVWEANLTPSVSGTHKFQLYGSSYFKLYMDGKLVLDRWRQNWNAWYHDFDLPMTAGTPVKLRLEWTPADGQIALLHNNPLPDAERHSLSLASEAAQSVDYYYVGGKDIDQVIAGYRELTGKAVMLPRWAYGFWQSRQRYENAEQLVSTVREYRKRNLPLDNIVEDWFYWREDDWGSHRFDPTRFPDPKGMVDALHGMNAHFMISVWPKFYPTTDNFKELDAKGFIYHRNLETGTHDWVGKSGYANSYYDPYTPEARAIYWRQIRDNLNVLGIDAWWLDASEPDIHSNLDPDELKKRIGPTALGSSTAYFNSYPLMHTTAVYDGERATDKDTRAFILTRSGFAGLQRNAAAVWSGDVASRWDDLHNQISAGVNYSMSGLPNWSFDIGGFALETRYSVKNPKPEDVAEWRELNLRWFQFGAFVPLFRSHGEFPHREIYSLAPEGSEVYNSLAWYDQLRYRLMPYIYTLAADTFHGDDSMLRGLPMDFAQDPKVRAINDEYLFGRAFLVSPVYEYKARARKVYLPAGTKWYDFYSNEAHDGGVEIDAAAPLARMPLFVKAGAIVPVGPAIQYTGQKPADPLTLYVYPGANGAFELYEDDGVTYGYERGEFARIRFSYDDATGAVTVGARTGRFPGMATARTIRIRWMRAGAPGGGEFDAAADATVQYTGVAQTVTRP